MTRLSDLEPTRTHRVIDLVREAGVDVDDWSNCDRAPSQNPKYCYSWSFVEPGRVVVLSLWLDAMSEKAGNIEHRINFRKDAEELKGKWIWHKRARDQDRALQRALDENLPVRVIINTGTRRENRNPDAERSHVKKRALDPEPWRIAFYDRATGENVLIRGRGRHRSAVPGNRKASAQRRQSRKRGTVMSNRPPMIYFNIGWMKEYKGTRADDPTIGGHAYLAEHDHGAESFNFLRLRNGKVRGYRPGTDRQLHIERLGAGRTDESISGVTVVWLARNPASSMTMIVGWYSNATVYRYARQADLPPTRINSETLLYSIEAQASDVTLLRVIARNFQVPRSRVASEGFGQNPTWYGSEAINRRVWSYISSNGESTRPSPRRPRGRKGPPKNLDPDLRRKIEKAAVRHATTYYKSSLGGRWKVESVEPLCRGWDLELTRRDELLLVEVKGLSGSEIVCELTPNEYRQMMSAQNRDRYVIYAVCNALSSPIASIFQHGGNGDWRSVDGRKLSIQERMGAVIRGA